MSRTSNHVPLDDIFGLLFLVRTAGSRRDDFPFFDERLLSREVSVWSSWRRMHSLGRNHFRIAEHCFV
jgi:hypothetical protein